MNVLFLTMNDFKSVNESGIYTDLLRYMKKQGHDVTVVTPIEKKYGKETSLAVENGVNVIRAKTGNLFNVGLVTKLISRFMLRFCYSRALSKYLKNKKIDLVLYTTPPTTLAPVVKIVKKKYGCVSYLMLKDIFPQNAVDLGMIKAGSIPHLVLRKFEKNLYEVSDWIGCMSPANVKFLLEHNSFIDPSHVEVAPNSIEVVEDKRTPEQIKEERNAIRQKYGLPLDKPVFIYGGNLGKPQGIPFLIECLGALKERADFHIVIAGGGTEFGKIQDWIVATKPQNVSLYNNLPKEDYETLAFNCDVGLIFLDHRFTIPNYPSRILSYLNARMPVVAATDPNSDIGKIAEGNGFGYWCESDDVCAFCSCVDKMLATDIRKMGENGYKFLLENYQVKNTYNAIMKHMGGVN